jgi:hypothetical protein
MRTQRKSLKRRSTQRAKNFRPRTAEQYFALSERSQEIQNRVAHVISEMRAENISLQEASRKFRIDTRTVIRWGSPALRKRANGRYAVKANDRLLRVLKFPTSDGLVEVALRDSRQASELAKYWDALDRYLAIGDPSDLHKFDGKRILDANGNQVVLLTDLRQLDLLGNAGVLRFNELYGRTA